jgi:hypothetical protein
MDKSEKAVQVVDTYLNTWAPYLLEDLQLVAELLEEAQAAGDDPAAMHDAAHAYFVSWCAVRASDLASEGGGGIVRATRPAEIWKNVAATDRFAAAEFGELRSPREKLEAWFDARCDEVMGILRHHNNGTAEQAIEILGEWMCRGFRSDDEELTRKRRTLVRTVALLRREFGTTDCRPEVPPEPESPVLREMREAARRDRQTQRETARATLTELCRRKRR